MAGATTVLLLLMGVLYTVHVVSAAPSPTTMTHLETTDPEATTNEVLSDEQYYKELLHNQEKELKGLKCVPVQGSVDIKSQLKSHDSLLDMQFFPQVAAVNRCHQECSFCGDHQFGIPRGSCVPESERKKTVIVFYLDGGHQKYRRVMLTEHTSCKCS